MVWVDLVALLALAQFIFFGVLVGRARVQFGVKAPATSGHEGFDRMYRVQMNTLELLVVFLPSLYLAARHFPATGVATAGAVYLLGRLVYWRAYVANPASRGLGFMLSALSAYGLLLAALVGTLRSLGA